MKFYKSKTFIVSLLTTVLIGMHAKYPDQTGAVLGGLACSLVTCDA